MIDFGAANIQKGASAPKSIGAVHGHASFYDVDGGRWVTKGVRRLLPYFADRRSSSGGSSTTDSGGSFGWIGEITKPIRHNFKKCKQPPAPSEEFHPYHDGSVYNNPEYASGRAKDEPQPSGMRHLLFEQIGSGAFSVVRRAVDPVTRDDVACKVLRLGDERSVRASDGSSTREEASHEINMLRRLGRHPSVPHLLDAYETTDGNVHIITDMLRGGELLAALHERGSLPEEDARRIFVRLMGAIKHIHARGVVHRDVKLENLVIDDPDDITSVKLIDFGLAADSFSDPMNRACGTLQCVAPEVIGAGIGGKRYCPKCDVWGAGVVLFQILSGYPPFEGRCVQDVTRLICKGKPNFNDPMWDIVSDSAVHLVKCLLEVNPRARLSPDQALRHPWVTAA
jgi:hypothetical protein